MLRELAENQPVLKNIRGSFLEQFIMEELGLAAEMANINNDYASVHYYAVSAYEPLKDSNVESLYTGVMNQINLKL